ncbi:hypothetical protein GCM10025857_14880 [Alicyclobacillus contaminans]|uniref:hypothetical protein n=1 Tax=Alicyclobacillus contaminans TaxID=392016 RepID=UPI00040E66EA|nr:hypothetical protein [Alicyclobacillus contaminans]GMA50131.1 hypothetical protein GCM10025857_14880 [Alicyclobacillus contaminans]
MAIDFAQEKRDFIIEYGDPITILRSSGNVSTFGRYVKGRQLLSPFEINFIRFMMFAWDSGVQRGDLIQNETTGAQFLVASTQEHTLQQSLVSVEAELYMVNYPTVEIQRVMPPEYDDCGNPVDGSGGWTSIASVPMTVEHVNGNVPYKDGLLLADTVFRLTMQTAVPLQLMERVIIDGNPYAVSDINRSVSPGLLVAQVKQDMR